MRSDDSLVAHLVNSSSRFTAFIDAILSDFEYTHQLLILLTTLHIGSVRVN